MKTYKSKKGCPNCGDHFWNCYVWDHLTQDSVSRASNSVIYDWIMQNPRHNNGEFFYERINWVNRLECLIDQKELNVCQKLITCVDECCNCGIVISQ